MRIRRRDLERVRVVARNLPNLTSDMGREVIRLRRAMRKASAQLAAGRPDGARLTLQQALEERWWR